MMKAWFRFAILALIICISPACYAWHVCLERTEFSFDHKGLVLLDPDHWNRKELSKMKASGITPVAWLNVGQIEAHRLLAADIKEKEITINRRYHPQGGNLARFYSPDFLALAKARVNEYLQKGFMGIMFARSEYFSKVSNSYINRSEMISLLVKLSNVVKSLNTEVLCIAHNNFDFFADKAFQKNFDGIIVEGLFNTKNRKHVHPWERKEGLAKLKSIAQSGKKVLCVDSSDKQSQKEFVVKRCKELGFEASFHRLPIKIKGEQ